MTVRRWWELGVTKWGRGGKQYVLCREWPRSSCLCCSWPPFPIKKLLDYLGCLKTFISYLAFVAHAYVFVLWLTLLFSFSNFSHFLLFTSLMCIYRQLSLPSSPCLLCKEHWAFIDSFCKRGSLVLWSPQHLFQIVFILLYSVHTTRRTNLFQRRSYQHLSSSSETTHPDKPCFVPAFTSSPWPSLLTLYD